jgi:hypothetical protein
VAADTAVVVVDISAAVVFTPAAVEMVGGHAASMNAGRRIGGGTVPSGGGIGRQDETPSAAASAAAVRIMATLAANGGVPA